jgi:hypothetical protein
VLSMAGAPIVFIRIARRSAYRCPWRQSSSFGDTQAVIRKSVREFHAHYQ